MNWELWRIVMACALAAGMAMGQEGPHPKMPQLSAATVRAAEEMSAQNVYRYTHERSAHTTGAWDEGKTFVLAVAAWQGDTKADAPLLRQIRSNLQGDRCLVAAGGYAAQHEIIFTGSCVLIRKTPRLWNAFTEEEQRRMDLLVKAAMVASAYTTSDAGNAQGQNTDLLGGKNLGRGWNPNFREGMIGTMIVATIWMGGADAAYRFLDTYDHQAFTEELRKAGLNNTAKTFGAAAADPASGAPEADKIERDVRGYAYQGTRLDDLMKLYWMLTTHTYGGTVSAGLNGGAGHQGAGRMARGADDLPNKGKRGMLHELDGRDGRGPRSSISYAYSGFRPNLVTHVILLAGGAWQPGPLADECLALMRIGIPDLFFKLEKGYLNFANGKATTEPLDINHPGWDFNLTRALWEESVSPFHERR